MFILAVSMAALAISVAVPARSLAFSAAAPATCCAFLVRSSENGIAMISFQNLINHDKYTPTR